MEKLPNISQSLIKSLFGYVIGEECGLVFDYQFIQGNLFPSSDVQKLGQFFEWKATGALPKDGKIPIPETTQKGELTAPYKKIMVQVENFKTFIAHHKIKILHYGYKMEYDGCEGTIDIVGEWDGRVVLIDLKTSGLLENKWSEFGWHLETLPNNQKTMQQPVHYVWLGLKEYKTILPWYFLVFSNTNEVDYKPIEVRIDPEKIETHTQTIADAKYTLEKHIKLGFKAYPEYKRCYECPLKPNCEHAAIVPKVETIDY